MSLLRTTIVIVAATVVAPILFAAHEAPASELPGRIAALGSPASSDRLGQVDEGVAYLTQAAPAVLRSRAADSLTAAAGLAEVQVLDPRSSPISGRMELHSIQSEANVALLSQTGSRNEATLLQSGTWNHSSILQVGNANLAAVVQNGMGHTSFILQQGTGNKAFVRQ
jgi:minor curlin subunit